MSQKTRAISLTLIVAVLIIFISKSVVFFSLNSAALFVRVIEYLCTIFLAGILVFLIERYISQNREQYLSVSYAKKLNNLLIELSHNPILYEGNISSVGQALTKKIADALEVDRCSVWLYNQDKTSILCNQLYLRKTDHWQIEAPLTKKDFPQYFRALDRDSVIIAEQAEIHPATSCFDKVYLIPLGIKSMLDVPIVYRGKTIGVICLETLTPRRWREIEINCAQLVSSLYAFSYSITDGNRKERRIIETEQFISKAALISITDASGKIIFANDKFIEVSGWTLDEILGKDHKIVNSGVHPKEFWDEMYQTVLRGEVWNKIVTNRKKNGELYYVDSYIRARFNDLGIVEGFSSIRHDVTDIMFKDQEIQNQLKAINKANAVIEFDINGNILYANDRFLNMAGYDYAKNGGLKEILGKHHSIFITDEQANSDEYKQMWSDLKGGKFISGEFRRLRKDGTYFWVSATYNPIIDINGRVYKIMKLANNITDSVKQNEEIEKKNTYLEHAAKILRHDMHSGINTYIPRGLSSLERRLSEEDIKSLKLEAPMKMIKEGLRHSQKVYRGVYEFTNLVKKDIVLTREKHNVKEILADYLSATAYKSQVLLDDSLPVLEVNDSLFCTAIDNLIRNGLKYNDSETKLVKLYFEEDYLIIEDNGRGLDQNDFEHLSRPYVRKEGQREAGSGLGLNICRAILSEHGYSITAERLKIGTKLRIKVK